MRARALVVVACGVWWALCTPALAVAAPHLGWRTITTPCCDVHYAQVQEHEAQHVAAVVDDCVKRATDLLHSELHDRLQIVLHDVTDTENGFANTVPYNRVELRTITPDDASDLARSDEWLRLLVQHEVFHIAHLDVVHGLPAVVNLVLGKSWPPNIVQPRLFVEGLAVWVESRFTSAGRLRSTTFATPLRLAALLGDRWSLDDAANASRRPPGAGAAYSYGAFFVDWLTRRYGTQLWAAYAHDYGGRAIPYAVQRSLESITGRDLALDWADFLDELQRDAQRLSDITTARGGPTIGRRLTRLGGAQRRPAFLPDGTLIIAAKPPDGPPGLYAIRGLPGAVPIVEPFLRTTELADVAVVDDVVVFSQSEIHRQWFQFRDLFVRERDGSVRQLTRGLRLRNPAPWPGTRQLVAEQRSGARSAIVRVDVDTGAVSEMAVARVGETLYTPRVSPDGRRIVVSRLDGRGKRSLAILDLAQGTWRHVVHHGWDDDDGDGDYDDEHSVLEGANAATPFGQERQGAIDPIWLDDDTIAYAADDDGVFCIFSVRVSTGERHRLVDTLGSASVPLPTPDGRGLLYADAHLDGADLWAIARTNGVLVAPVTVVDAPADTVPSSPTTTTTSPQPSAPYQPWSTLWPRTWRPVVAGDLQQGLSLGLAVNGTDAAELASWTVAIASDAVVGRPSAALNLRLLDLAWPVTLAAEWRPLTLLRGRTNDGAPEWHQENQLRTGASLSIPRRRRRFSHSLSLGAQRVMSLDDTGVTSRPDSLSPDLPRSVKQPTQQAFTVEWFYSGTEQYRDSISTEWGLSAALRLRVADRRVFSDVDVRELSIDVRAFQPVPGLHNHVVAALLTGGFSSFEQPGSPLFLGGFVNRSLLDDVVNGPRGGLASLRGFPVAHLAGNGLGALTLEYRFPLLEIERGQETLPLFVDRVWGAAFVDVGAAFADRPSRAGFALGMGGELRLLVTLGYYGRYVVRAGYARGLTTGGVDQPYMLVGVPW